MANEHGFLNLFPNEMRYGDIWGEGQEIIIVWPNPTELTYEIHFHDHKNGDDCESLGCELHWPDNAPKRILRRERVDG